jgi:RNA polymerase sigma factor (sigma-70 family)
MEASTGSVTRCIQQFKAGDDAAFEKIWQHYFDQLLGVARDVMKRRRQWGAADENDIVQNALWSVCRGLPHNKSYEGVNSRESLWPILVAITKFKVADNYRREAAAKRGGGKVVSEGALEGSASRIECDFSQLIADRSPTADDIVELTEQLQSLMELLEQDDLKEVAQMHLEGWKNNEIAQKLGVSSRTVERKLSIIRDTWFEWWERQENV